MKNTFLTIWTPVHKVLLTGHLKISMSYRQIYVDQQLGELDTRNYCFRFISFFICTSIPKFGIKFTCTLNDHADNLVNMSKSVRVFSFFLMITMFQRWFDIIPWNWVCSSHMIWTRDANLLVEIRLFVFEPNRLIRKLNFGWFWWMRLWYHFSRVQNSYNACTSLCLFEIIVGISKT